MIFKRYSSPFIFLDNLLETGRLIEHIDFLIEQTQEEKWWELYLATLPLNERPYAEWKKESQGNTNKSNFSILTSKIDAEETIKKSKDILSGFKPPQ